MQLPDIDYLDIYDNSGLDIIVCEREVGIELMHIM